MFRRIIKRKLQLFIKYLSDRILFDIMSNSNSVNQIALKQLYKSQQNTPDILSIKEAGFSVFSQHEEDGMLLYIFSLIGETNKKCIEICIGTGIESNTANLLVNHKWEGLLFDGDDKNIAIAKNFYSKNKQTCIWRPVIRKEWITVENINGLITRDGFEGEIDMLSIDIDGNDYWLWKEINVVNPRVVILEFNHLWGPDESVTVPYNPEFRAVFTDDGSDYAGASLAAMVKLGKEKGYRLVATNAFATNAIFVRNDISHQNLPEISSKDCFKHSRAKFGMTERIKNVKNLKWEKI